MRNCSASEAPRRRRDKGDRRVAFFFFALLVFAGAMALAGCAGQRRQDEAAASSWRGSVVVFSFGALRADHVGALGGLPGLTPQLDRFAAEADFAGRAVAASSSPVVSIASLMTGTGALQHRLLGHFEPHLRPSLPTLAELFWAAGYDTVFFEPGPLWMGRYGLTRGMARTETMVDRQVLHELPLFDAVPRFYWIALPEVGTSYGELGADRLMPYADPRQPLPEDLRRQAAELFRLEVAAGDARLGRFLDALRSSAAWPETLVVVTAATGTELGEHGGTLYGQNLYRESIEVPLLIRLPASLKARGFAAAEAAGTPVAAERLFATLAESIGREAPPICSPSLYRQARRPAISALPMGNGVSLFSAVFAPAAPGAATEQLIRSSRFAPAEADYFAAQAAEAGAPVTLAERPRELFERLHRGFEQAPLWESAEVKVEQWTWTGASGAVRGDDPGRLARLAGAFERAVLHDLDAERSIGQERELIGAVEMAAEEAGGLDRKDEGSGQSFDAGSAAGAPLKGESAQGGAGR